MAVLIGLEGREAATWIIYSESAKPGVRIRGESEYDFYESIVDALHPSVRQGIKSILVAAPSEKEYSSFMDHIRKHQGWMLGGWSLNTVSFTHIPEPAMRGDQVRELVKAHDFVERLADVTQGDIRQVMDVLERRLSDPEGIETVLFTLREVEDSVYGDERRPEYILVTDAFSSRNRRRMQRLLQIATNKNIGTRIIEAGSPAGFRITQFGGLVCMLRE